MNFNEAKACKGTWLGIKLSPGTTFYGFRFTKSIFIKVSFVGSFVLLVFNLLLLWEFQLLVSMPNFPKEISDYLWDVLPGFSPSSYYNISSIGTAWLHFRFNGGGEGLVYYRKTLTESRKAGSKLKEGKKSTEHRLQWKGKVSLPASPCLKGHSPEARLLLGDYFPSLRIFATIFSSWNFTVGFFKELR